MLLAALLDAGCPLEPVRAAIRACGVTEVEIGTAEALRAGLRGLLLRVEVTGPPRRRGLEECLAAVAAAGLPPAVEGWASTALRRLGAAEARLHGIALERVELHELGAVDTLVDVVGVCIALHVLGAADVLCSPLPAASGSVATEHGILPLPAPATLALLAEAGAPLRPGIPGLEQVTPTAAALLTTVARFAPPDDAAPRRRPRRRRPRRPPPPQPGALLARRGRRAGRRRARGASTTAASSSAPTSTTPPPRSSPTSPTGSSPPGPSMPGWWRRP